MVTGSCLGKEKLCIKYFGDGGLFVSFWRILKKKSFFLCFSRLFFLFFFLVFLAIYLLKGSKKHAFPPRLLCWSSHSYSHTMFVLFVVFWICVGEAERQRGVHWPGTTECMVCMIPHMLCQHDDCSLCFLCATWLPRNPVISGALGNLG